MPKDLKDLFVKNIKVPGDYSDGPNSNGLKLRVRPVGDDEVSKSWIQRVYIKNPKTGKTVRTRDLALGNYPGMSLAEARVAAEENQATADQGIDPRPPEVAEDEDANTITFTGLANELLKEERQRHLVGDIREGTLKKKEAVYKTYILSAFVDRPVDGITSEEIESWAKSFYRKRDTFKRVWAIAGVIFNRAILRTRLEVNPVNDTVLDSLAATGRPRHKPRHYDSVPHHLVPEALDAIRHGMVNPRTIPSSLALHFVTLTGCRSVEARTARYSDLRCKSIDSPTDWGDGVTVRRNGTPNFGGWEMMDWNEFERGTDKSVVWFIPPEYAKMDKWHRVPLSTGALSVLREARALLHDRWGSALLFPSYHRPHGFLDRTTLARRCRNLGLDGTPHGFRTSLRIWCAVHDVPETAAELALSHELQGVVGAYMRSDLLAIRASIMEFWAKYLRGELPEDWEWVSPKARAEIEELKRQNRALTEQLNELRGIHDLLLEIASNQKAAEARAQAAEERAERAEARALKAERQMAEMQTILDKQSAMPI